MIIKTKRSNICVLIIILLLIASYISLDRRTLDVSIHDAFENYMALEPGFSSIRNLSDPGGDIAHQSIFKKGRSLIFSVLKSFSHRPKNPDGNKEEEISIIIKFSNYEKILDDRANAIKLNYLKNPGEVAAKINYQGRQYRAKVRLKGDLPDHWLGSIRHSLRVKLKDGETIFGLNKFSLHKPFSRQYPYEQAFQYSLRNAGNLASNHRFARVNVNGKNWGIMNVEENISKFFLEKQRVKDSLVFRFADDRRWLEYDRVLADAYPNYRYSDSKLIASVYEHKRYFKDELSRLIYTYVLEKRLQREHSNLYAKEPHLRAFLSSLVWNNMHTLQDNNSRYYFNPYNLTLEPITRDQGAFSSIATDVMSTLQAMDLSEPYKQVLSSLINSETGMVLLGDGIKHLGKFNVNLNRFNSYFPLDEFKNTDLLTKNAELIIENKNLVYDWIENFEVKKASGYDFSKFPSDLQATYFDEHLHVRHYDDGRLLLFNLLPDEIEISKIVVDGNEISLGKITVPGFTYGNYEPHIVQSGLKGIFDGKIIVHSSYQNTSRSILAYPTLLSVGIYNPLIESTAHQLPSFMIKRGKAWEVTQGEWLVEGPLIVEGDLYISKGTHLKFASDSYLLVKGALRVYGSPSSPVIFEGLVGQWKGLYVLAGKSSDSVINSTIFKNTSGVNDGLLELTGGVNFYKGSVEMNGVSFDGSAAEDALNIVNASITIDNLSIRNSVSDAFDCDFCRGTITESYFDKIGGDGLDLSGSAVDITGTVFKNITDKALSVGEASTVRVVDSDMSNVGVGIASKDGSSASVKTTTIRNYVLYAGMTYSKKKHYNLSSSLEFLNCVVEGNDPFLRQVNTFLTVDDVEIMGREVNVETLYSSGVMGK